MAAPKGNKFSAGRPPGATNKFTTSVKEAFSEAFDKLGGVEALVIWGKENPTDFYKLASKLIPTDVNLAVKEIPQARVFPLGIQDEPELSENTDSVH